MTGYQRKNEEGEYEIYKALQLFEQVCNSRWLDRNVAKILFLNKYDLFLEKLKTIPLTVSFPQYTGSM